MNITQMGGDNSHSDVEISLVEMACKELERIRQLNKESERCYHSFPPACLRLLRNTEGNSRCMDCGEHNAEWATISFGALLCLQCSGYHRSFGVQVSCVRSINMDDWSVAQIVSMLEGGNQQLHSFFERHALTEGSCTRTEGESNKAINKSNVTRLRYKTKAARFYRQQMELHVAALLKSGPYRGRDNARKVQNAPSLDRRNSNAE